MSKAQSDTATQPSSPQISTPTQTSSTDQSCVPTLTIENSLEPMAKRAKREAIVGSAVVRSEDYSVFQSQETWRDDDEKHEDTSHIPSTSYSSSTSSSTLNQAIPLVGSNNITQKRLASVVKLLNKIRENERAEDETIKAIQTQITWFRGSINEIKRKVDNDYSYKNSYEHSHHILDTMRHEYQQQLTLWINNAIRKTIQDLRNQSQSSSESGTIADQIEWLLLEKNVDQVKNIIVNHARADASLSEELIDQMREEYLRVKEEQYNSWVETKVQTVIDELDARLAQCVAKDHLPIVWGMPDLVAADKVDDFVYLGSTPKKTVYIPFRDIHKQLTDSNCIMRAGVDTKQNYLLGHMVFVVTDSVHNNPAGKYTGGRAFIDFPIVLPFNILAQDQLFDSHESYTKFIQEHNSHVGKYPYYIAEKHSEAALSSFLTQNVSGIVSCLKNKLTALYGSNENFKVYAAILFINSQKNVCSRCEQELYSLMTSHTEGSFLYLLKKELTDNNLKTLTNSNDKFPYMFISVSAHELYIKHCSSTLASDVRNALEDEPMFDKDYLHLSINIKQITGKVILSTAEKWLDGQDNLSRCIQVFDSLRSDNPSSAVKIPFYTGFRSAAGVDNMLKEYYQKLQYAAPNF